MNAIEMVRARVDEAKELLDEMLKLARFEAPAGTLYERLSRIEQLARAARIKLT